MPRAYKVIQTTDLGVMERIFVYVIPDKVVRLSDRFLAYRFFTVAEVEAGGDNMTRCTWLSSQVLAYSRAVALGMSTYSTADLYVGERFYFADNSYIRISQKSATGGSYPVYTIKYDYYKNGILIGSYTNASIWADGVVPLLPYCFTGNAGSGDIAQADSFILMANERSGEPSLEWYSGPGKTIANNNWLNTYYDDFTPVDLDDPYMDIENSEPSGPAEGVGIPESDPVDIPGLPSFSATDTGFVTIFNPTLAQVKALADYMWNGLFDLNNFRKIFADPMDCILGFNMVPVNVPSSGAGDVCIGNILSSVSMNIASGQWVELDCGELDLGLPYGSYLDFSPYTKYSIYLPYIGTCDLSADDVAGKTLHLVYHVDVLSCACVAYLKCDDSVLYQWTGSCGYAIPVTQNDFSRMIMAIMSIVAAGVGGAVTGGAGAAIAQAGASSAKNVMGLKPDVHRSGSIGSSAGLMGGQTPYLILEVPKACKPAKQYHYLGYPSFTTVKLGNVTGRQDFEAVILDGIPCTEEERDMIAAACAGGIYL